jgi:hypothetical protein
MSMQMMGQIFSDRLTEIDSYLDLLDNLEAQVRSGPPHVGSNGPVISTDQQKILYSSVYLQLYNLIEATVSQCVNAVCTEVGRENRWLPADLSADLRREWVRSLARTHTDLNYEHRLSSSLKLCQHLIDAMPVGTMKIEKGGGGNWDDVEIFRLAERLGCNLSISPESSEAAKKPFRNDLGALALIVRLRNDLAHGLTSFVECGDGVTAADLRELKDRTAKYLTEVVGSFAAFIQAYHYLTPGRRPTEAVV